MKKNVTTTVALLSLLILCSSLSNNDIYVISQTTISTTTVLTVDVNPIGIGQMVTFYASIQPPFPSSVNVFPHYVVNLTLPDGNYQAYIPQKYASDGSFTINFVPTQIGNYTAVLNFPGKTFDNGATYLPSASQAITLKVIATQVPSPIPSPTTPPP
ncbi:MAG: hypothetical protein ACM3UL_01485, partial [Ignavibacteria bacterium]